MFAIFFGEVIDEVHGNGTIPKVDSCDRDRNLFVLNNNPCAARVIVSSIVEGRLPPLFPSLPPSNNNLTLLS